MGDCVTAGLLSDIQIGSRVHSGSWGAGHQIWKHDGALTHAGGGHPMVTCLVKGFPAGYHRALGGRDPAPQLLLYQSF